MGTAVAGVFRAAYGKPGNWPTLKQFVACLVCALSLALFSEIASAQSGSSKLPNNVRRSDVLLLPQFCWGYFIAEMKKPEYLIPPSCGPYTNHYCEELLPFYTAKVRGLTGSAREQVIRRMHKYSVGFINNIKIYPACPIRSYAESILTETEAMLGQMRKLQR